MNNEEKEYTFLWFIENYSYCCDQSSLVSSEFIVEGLALTAWNLQLYPRGQTGKNKGNICLYLNRNKRVLGPEEIPLKYELSFLAGDGSALISGGTEVAFKKGAGYGMPAFPQIDDVLLGRKADYLPQDTLRVRCRIWKGQGGTNNVTQYSARTRIGVEKISFLHKVENFIGLKPNEKKIIKVQSPTKSGCVVSNTLYLTEWEGKICVEIANSSSNYKLSILKLSLLDGLGNVIECGEVDNRFDATRGDIEKMTLSLTRQEILKRKSEYLPSDELSLMCECTFSTGVEFEKIEETQHELPREAIKQSCNNESNNNGCYAAHKLAACPSALDDFKAVYNSQFLTDVELKTKTKSFPAHKNVLCARSSVFKVMMTNDMKERNTDCIQIDDLEDDIVQQLLLFLYSDQLENLEWESAIKLYYAADKYEVGKLKVLCSSFLVENLSTSTASELLLLADTHSDSRLKNDVESFILKHEEQVYGSDEWGNLIETHPVLVSRTMCLKYKR